MSSLLLGNALRILMTPVAAPSSARTSCAIRDKDAHLSDPSPMA